MRRGAANISNRGIRGNVPGKGLAAEIRSDFPMRPDWSVAEYASDCH